jgi:phosphoserine phosphatase RsbU/P
MTTPPHSRGALDFKGRLQIRIAASGARALDLAKVEPQPDLILLDVMMPDMAGYEVCGRLKASEETRDIPVIFLTLKMEVADETRGFEVGAVDYIHKPFSLPIVNARVRTHLLLREAHASLARQLIAINNELEMERQIQLAILPRETPKIQGVGDRRALHLQSPSSRSISTVLMSDNTEANGVLRLGRRTSLTS